jgi:fructokinase
MDRVLALGECLIDFVATAPGSLQMAPAFEKAAGGAPANVAACVARLGGSSAFVGKRGDDAFGDFLERVLQECGVDTRWFTRAPARTALAFVSLDERGERDFLFYRDGAADTLLSPADIVDEMWHGACALHVGSVSLAVEPSRGATLHAIHEARRRGVRVSFDVNWRPALWPTVSEARPLIEAVLALSDIVKVNQEELALLTGTDDPPKGAFALHRFGTKVVLVTLGADGAFYSCRPEDAVTSNAPRCGHVPAPRVEAVDTTGAGDAFVGAFLYELSRHPDGLPQPAHVRNWTEFAVRVAARVTTRRGAIPAMPTRAEVE